MVTEESIAVKIRKKKGEQVRLFLQKNELIRSDLKIKRNNHFLFIPVKKTSELISEYDLVTTSFEKTKLHPSDYKQLLSIPKNVLQQLPTSFDIIGDILLIKLPEELLSFSSEIGNALLKTHSHVSTICAVDPVSGEFRSRSVTVIAGEPKTRTIHKEFGLLFSVDIEKTYFSPRLATERKRVSSLIRKNSSVFDMFCGVAPFSVMIARYAHPAHILAIDKNPIAIQLAERNITRNKVKDKITLINEDAVKSKKILEDHDMIPDHIIMNLPFSSFEFFPTAIQSIAHNGIIHYYDIISESDIENRIRTLKKIAKKYNTKLVRTQIHKIKTYAPHEFYIGIDITVSKINH